MWAFKKIGLWLVSGCTRQNLGFQGAAWHRGSILASHSAAPGLNLGVRKNYSLDVAVIDLIMIMSIEPI